MIRLLVCLYLALGIFAATLAVYSLGIIFGLCTWSPQLITIVALNDLMVAAVIWMFWD